jgi:hypothetical protein
MESLMNAVKAAGYLGMVSTTCTAMFEIVRVYVNGQYVGKYNHATKILCR